MPALTPLQAATFFQCEYFLLLGDVPVSRVLRDAFLGRPNVAVLHELDWCPCPHILPCCHLLHSQSDVCMQNADGDEAHGLCRGEVSGFMKYFARQLAEKCVRLRLQRENIQTPCLHTRSAEEKS